MNTMYTAFGFVLFLATIIFIFLRRAGIVALFGSLLVTAIFGIYLFIYISCFKGKSSSLSWLF